MTVILLRHGRSSANTAATLAGRAPGVGLDETGRHQAADAARRLRGLPLAGLVCSPMQRCLETLAPLAEATGLEPEVENGIAEVDYGDWTGRRLADLVHEPLWDVIQRQPSAATFPGGEGLAAVQARSVGVVRDRDRRLRESHDNDVLWVACTHGDVIKSILADALGVHLDGFQRIATVPASVSVIRYTSARPIVQHMNDTGSALDRLARSDSPARPGDDPENGRKGRAGESTSTAVPGGEL